MIRSLLFALLVGCTAKDSEDSEVPTLEDLDGDGSAGEADCDDTDAAISPDAAEICDGVDNNCDGVVDTDAEDATTWYADADRDGRGDPKSPSVACEQPLYTVSNDSDCDDTQPTVYAGRPEECDGLDNDCDGEIDPPDASGTSVYFADADGDNHGDGAKSVESCSPPSGFVESSDDCDDDDPAAYPGAEEVCDGSDNDCDGGIDPATSTGASTWYRDQDGDGVGDSASDLQACDAPSGYVAESGDCNDRDADIQPGALEFCDGLDNNCDGSIDPDTSEDASEWYGDGDGDGYAGLDLVSVACDPPAGYLPDAYDCDDTRIDVNPVAPEVCDGVDNNCDGTTDPASSTGAPIWYRDADGDAHGDASTAVLSCAGPEGYVALGDDCDDAEPLSFPGNIEACDGLDNDCDGAVDPGDATDASVYYADADADGYGDPAGALSACALPAGYVSDASDCNDAAASAYPGAPEQCDGLDNDCDGGVDPDTSLGTTTWFADDDADGYGDPASTTEACSLPSGYAESDDDCDPSDSSIYPGALDTPGDGIDQDCDGVDDSCADWELGSATGLLGTGNLSGAGNDSAGSCGGSAGSDQSFHWTAPNDGYFRFDNAGGTFDSVIYLLDGTCTGTELACNDQAQADNNSEVTLQLTAGQSVILVVDNYTPRYDGAYPLNINELDPADCTTGLDTDGDGLVDCSDPDCASAPVCDYSLADANLETTTGNPVAAGNTTSVDANWNTACSTTTSRDYTYSWVASANATYYYSTYGSFFDTILSLWSPEGPVEMECGDDPITATGTWSEVYFTPRAGQRMYVTVDGYSAYYGNYYLRIYAI